MKHTTLDRESGLVDGTGYGHGVGFWDGDFHEESSSGGGTSPGFGDVFGCGDGWDGVVDAGFGNGSGRGYGHGPNGFWMGSQ